MSRDAPAAECSRVVVQRRHLLGDDLAEGESAPSSVRADRPYRADRKLEGGCDGRLDRRYRGAQPGRLLEGGSQALPGHRMACDGWRVRARAFTRFAAETGNVPRPRTLGMEATLSKTGRGRPVQPPTRE